MQILAPDSVMCHVIDNSDHWEHGDKRLSRINYLRYRPFTWRLVNPAGQGIQNRMRHSEYLAFFQMRGFDIPRQRRGKRQRAAQRALAETMGRLCGLQAARFGFDDVVHHGPAVRVARHAYAVAA